MNKNNISPRMFLIIFIIVIVTSVAAIILIYLKPQAKAIIQIFFGLAIIILTVLLIRSIMLPIRFNKERIKRESAAIERLKDIRTIQVAYKDKYGNYTSSFDSLINFVKYDSFKLENIVQVADWNEDEMTMEEALEEGILVDSVQKVAVKDSLLLNYNPVDELSFVPYGNGLKYDLETGEVLTRSGINVKVFEASVLYADLFKGLDHQLVVNYIDERFQITSFDGLKVGSLTEATNNSGNWEK